MASPWQHPGITRASSSGVVLEGRFLCTVLFRKKDHGKIDIFVLSVGGVPQTRAGPSEPRLTPRFIRVVRSWDLFF